VQGFGNALQAALERRDGEQLNLLRAQHQQQILDLTTKAREQERDAAANAVAALERHRQTVENRKAYFVGLVDCSLSAEEQAERISRHVASGARMTEAALGFLAGALHLIPQLGSPFAMKYGGVETARAGLGPRSRRLPIRTVGGSAPWRPRPDLDQPDQAAPGGSIGPVGNRMGPIAQYLVHGRHRPCGDPTFDRAGEA
jgi:hypothetical protein